MATGFEAGGPRRLNRSAVLFLAAALLCLDGAARAQDAPPAGDDGGLTILSRGPDAEFRVRGVSLKSVRADDAQNTVAFDFNGPVSDAAFARLQAELPDWVEMAYAGYDNAIIRAKRPVTFQTRAESDGFSLRMVPRDGGATAPPSSLRGADDAGAPPAPPPPQPASPRQSGRDWHEVPTYFARASAERPFDVSIRGFYDAVQNGGGGVVTIAGDWRHAKGETLITSDARADIDMWSGVHLLADVHDVVVNAKAVRQPNLAITPYNHNDVSGALGVAIPFDDATVTAEVLYGRGGLGGRLGVTEGAEDWRIGLRAAYREPYTDTAEAVSLRGSRDYSAVYASGQIFDGLWGTLEGRGTRYEVKGDENAAQTAAFHAGLRYDIDGWPVSLTYDADGEYVVGRHYYNGAAPTPFVPLSIANREVHQFGGAFSERWNEQLWFDLYGGYAIDRYSTRGAYGGAALRLTPVPGFDIALNGRYSTVSEREGEPGNVLTAGLTLSYALGDAPMLDSL